MIELAAIRAYKLQESLKERYSSSTSSKTFWSSLRKNFKTSSSLNAFVDENVKRVRDPAMMLGLAATHYEKLFAKTEVYKPHPYDDGPELLWDN